MIFLSSPSSEGLFIAQLIHAERIARNSIHDRFSLSGQFDATGRVDFALTGA
jgi:hypothetical protein